MARAEELDGQAAQLNGSRLAAVHIRGPGTDLRIPMHVWAQWRSGRERSAAGRTHLSNLPTEEIWITPGYHGVEGHVSATRSAVIDGAVEILQLVAERNWDM